MFHERPLVLHYFRKKDNIIYGRRTTNLVYKRKGKESLEKKATEWNIPSIMFNKDLATAKGLMVRLVIYNPRFTLL